MRERTATFLALAVLLTAACSSEPTRGKGPSPRHRSLVPAPLFYVGPFAATHTLYAIRPGDSRATRLPIRATDVRDPFASTWGLAVSPDGTRIAACRSSEGIYVFALDGMKLHRVIRHEFDAELRPCWSKDGTYLLYPSTYVPTGKNRYGEGTSSQIFVANTVTGEITQLTHGEAFRCYPSWSPDNSRIAFTSSPAGSTTSDIYVMDFPAGRTERVTQDGFEKRYVSWSPVEDLIAYVAWEGDDTVLKVVEVSTKTIRTLSTRPHTDTIPAWSPDGRKIAFSGWSETPSAEQIRVINRDGSGERRLTAGVEAKRCPQWSPDGSEIAFKVARRNRFDIDAINSDGTNLRRISIGTEGGEGQVWGFRK